METPERVRHSLDGYTILLVEDNEDEVFMMQRTFRKANIPNPLQVAVDGIEAVEYLEGQGKFTDRIKFPFPVVVFLDLNLPKKGGLEVLEYVRQQPHLRKVVVNVLSSSTRPADIEQAAFLGANTYFIKPSRLEKLQELIENWYSLARFEAYPGKS
jgi:CheY-like chemotaxis protein